MDGAQKPAAFAIIRDTDDAHGNVCLKQHRGDGARARHVYQTSGFTEEGVMRNAYKPADESRIDLVLMSLLTAGLDCNALVRKTAAHFSGSCARF
jgi:hypothetical protein